MSHNTQTASLSAFFISFKSFQFTLILYDVNSFKWVNYCTPFRFIYFKEKVAPLTAPLQQLVNGLEIFGILDMMEQNKGESKTIFVKNDVLTWSVDTFHDLIETGYISSGWVF